MKHWWSYAAAAAFVASVTLLAFYFAASDAKLARALTVAAAALAGSAGLVAAFATADSAASARRAASGSEATALQTKEALARTLRPTLTLSGWVTHTGQGGISISVDQSFAAGVETAVDVDLEYELADGTVGRDQVGRVSSETGGEPSFFSPVTNRPPVEDNREAEGFRRATVWFWDSRRTGQWRQDWVVHPFRSWDGGWKEAHWTASEPVLLN